MKTKQTLASHTTIKLKSLKIKNASLACEQLKASLKKL